MADVIDYQILGDDLQLVEVELDFGEGVRAEEGIFTEPAILPFGRSYQAWNYLLTIWWRAKGCCRCWRRYSQEYHQWQLM